MLLSFFSSALSLWEVFGNHGFHFSKESMRSLCWGWTSVGPINALRHFEFFFRLGLLERFVQSPLRPWGSRAQHQMHHRAHWDQPNPDEGWLCLDIHPSGLVPFIREVSYYSYGEITQSVSKKYVYSYNKGFLLLLFLLGKEMIAAHCNIDIDPSSLLTRSGLLTEAVPWGLTQCGQPCSALPSPILSVLTHLGPALPGELAALRETGAFFL